MTQITLQSEELEGLPKTKAQQIKATFKPMVEMLETFEEEYEAVLRESLKGITEETTYKAKSLRLKISKVRIDTGKLKDEQKAEYLRASNAIQGVHNVVVWAVQDKENKLREIEKHFENLEKQRLVELQNKRAAELSHYLEDADKIDLAKLEEDVWQAYYSSKKTQYEDRIKAEKAAKEEQAKKEARYELEKSRRIKVNNFRMVLKNNEPDIALMTAQEFDKYLTELKS